MRTGRFAEKYSISQRIGVGAMCEVYRATQQDLDRVVALKLLKEDLATYETEKERFLREARTCSQLHHRNIVEIYEVDVAEGQPYIAMEFIDGTNLKEILAEGLPPRRGVEILKEVAEALQCAHDAGVVHRDLKPENILVDGDGAVKVVDWGIAKMVTEARGLTRTGMIVGTPEYMAPEQIRSAELTPRTDLYALGVVLFEVVAGKQPFKRRKLADVLQSHLEFVPPTLAEMALNVPPPLTRLVSTLLAKNPEKRPQRAAAVADELREILPLLPARMARRRVPVTTRRRSVWVNLVAMGVCLLCLGLLIYSWGPFGPTPPTLEIRGVSLTAPASLEIRYLGSFPGNLTAEVYALDSPARRLVGRQDIDTSQARTVGTDLRTLTVTLTTPIVERSQLILVQGASRRPFVLDPRAALEKALVALHRLQGERLCTLLGELKSLRAIVAKRVAASGTIPVEVTRRFHDLLAAAGLDEGKRSSLAARLDRLPLDGLRLDALPATLLFPLRAIEVAIGDSRGLSLPWKPVSLRFAVSFQPFARLDPIPSYEGGTPLAKTSLLTEVSGRKRRLWLGTPSFLRRARLAPRLSSLTSVAWGTQTGEAPAFIDDYRSSATVSFDLVSEPPDDAVLCLATAYFPREMALRLRLNDAPEVLVLNHTCLTATSEVWADVECWLICVRIDPTLLRRGSNTVRIGVEDLPGQTPLLGMGLAELSLYAGAKPRNEGR